MKTGHWSRRFCAAAWSRSAVIFRDPIDRILRDPPQASVSVFPIRQGSGRGSRRKRHAIKGFSHR